MKKQKVKRKSETITINRKTYDNLKRKLHGALGGLRYWMGEATRKDVYVDGLVKQWQTANQRLAGELSVSRDEIKLKQDAIEGLKKMIVSGIKEEVKAQMEQEKPKPWYVEWQEALKRLRTNWMNF